jgi:hypothetical protein
VIEIDAPIDRETLEALKSLDQVIEARSIELS